MLSLNIFKKLHSLFLVLALVFGGIMAFTPNISYAENFVLTKVLIEQFYDEAANAQLLPEKEGIAFLQTHTHPSIMTTLYMTYDMLGLPTKKDTVNYNKADIIRTAKKGYQMGEVKESENKVLRVNVAPGGQSATVKVESEILSMMNVPTPAGLMLVRSEQVMTCEDALILGAGNVIQIKKSECKSKADMRAVR